jgi:hypothetical protein
VTAKQQSKKKKNQKNKKKKKNAKVEDETEKLVDTKKKRRKLMQLAPSQNEPQTKSQGKRKNALRPGAEGWFSKEALDAMNVCHLCLVLTCLAYKLYATISSSLC